MKAYALCLLITSFGILAHADDDGACEAAVLKDQKCLTGKCFANAKDSPNFDQDPNPARLLDNAALPTQGKPDAAKDGQDI